MYWGVARNRLVLTSACAVARITLMAAENFTAIALWAYRDFDI